MEGHTTASVPERTSVKSTLVGGLLALLGWAGGWSADQAASCWNVGAWARLGIGPLSGAAVIFQSSDAAARGSQLAHYTLSVFTLNQECVYML